MARVFRDRRGVVLIPILLGVATLLVLAASTSTLVSGEHRASTYWKETSQAFYVAESGLNHCMWKLKHEGPEIEANEGVYGVDPPTFTSQADEVAGVLDAGKSYQVWVLTDATDPFMKHVTVKAYADGQTHVLKARVRQEQGPPFYNPEGKGFLSSDPDDPAIYGPDLPNLGWLILYNNAVRWLDPGEYFYEGIIIYNNAKLRLKGEVTLWVRQKVECYNNCIVNPSTDNRRLFIFMPRIVANQQVIIRNNAVVNAFIYAPDATATLRNNGSLTGLLVAKSCDFQNNARYSPDGEGEPWPAEAVIDWQLIGYGD